MPKPQFFKPRLEPLEERCLLSASSAATVPAQSTYENLVQASVVGEKIFYNDSVYDTNSPSVSAAGALGSADDAAIATDKTALLPGQTATFANYTSYVRGINGIMVDIAGLPANVTAADFVFTVGNSNDPTKWTQLTVAPTVTVRWGTGVQGSARVELTWPNNTIENEWLQVTVLADANTGLSANNVFYFGNAVGDTGNSTTNAQVNLLDLNGMPSSQRAGITNVYDFTRQGFVNSVDASIVRNNMTTAATALNLITVPAAPTPTPFALETPDFMPALGSNYYYFAPEIVETNDGTLISVGEERTTPYDASVPGLAETMSHDGGQTWSPVTVIATAANYPANTAGSGELVVDHTTGAVFLIYTINNNTVFSIHTVDDGQTWSDPQDITSSVMAPGWNYFAPGIANGIQLTVGANAGRLVVAFDYRFVNTTTDPSVPSYDAVIYSDDNGATWKLGGGPVASNPVNAGVNENSIAQLADGTLYMNSRLKNANNTAPARGYSYSYDGGMTWTTVQYAYSLPVSSVEGSLLSLDANTLLFAAPDDVDNNVIRQQMTIWASFDQGVTWTKERIINYDFAGYSDMVSLGNDTALLVFEGGQDGGTDATIQKSELVKFNLAALLSPQPNQFTWNFNEQSIGQPAPIGGSSIRDDGVLNERGTVQSSGGIPYYVAGSNGDEALRIVNGSNVLLSPATTDGLQFGTGQSFTFQFVLRTTAANGVLLGEMPTDPGYTFSLVNGAITLNVNDGTNSATLTGGTINDGAWHTVVGIRDTATKTLSLYVDGTLAATAVDNTGSLQNADDVTLGSYANGSGQLTFDIDLLQATRGALAPSQFLTSSYVPTQTLPAPVTAASNVLNLPGVGFYLPPYDDRHYFADLHESDTMPAQPAQGTAGKSAIDATGNYDVQTLSAATVYYESNPTVGTYWSSQLGSGWTVANSNGTQSPSQNFDYVQNSETFTISDVFNVPSVPTSGDLVLVGNNYGTTALPGFDLTVGNDGDLDFSITDGSGSGVSLISQHLATFASTGGSLPQLSTGGWYQVVIVGNGAGAPLQYYLTPMTALQVQQYQTSQSTMPAAAPTATGATQNLQIGNVYNGVTSTQPATLNFKDLAIFNQALTPSQVEQLFLDEASPPAVTASGTINTFTVGGAAVAIDSGLTVSSADADLTGATVTISPGTLHAGDQLNFTNQNGISGSYSGGVLTLSGSATPAQYQAALQSITFSSTSGSLCTTNRAISVVADNGPLTSNSAAEVVNVSTALPVLDPSGRTNAFTFAGAPVAVDSGLMSPSSTLLTGATVTISADTLEPGDVLHFTNQGGISGSYAAGVLTLTGVASASQYQAALQSVTFSTTFASTLPRTISFVAIDGALNGIAAIEELNIYVVAPVVTPSGIINTYLVGGAPMAVDAGVTVTSSAVDLSGLTATISPGTLQPGDVLNFTNQNGISGSYAGGVLTLSGSATPAQYQAALQSVTFSSASIATVTRTISVVAFDNSDNQISKTVVVSLYAGKDVLTPSGLAVKYTAGASAVQVDPGLQLSSLEADLTGATVTIAPGSLQAGDTLQFTIPSGSGITGSYTGGVLTLSGNATPAQYQAALQSVTFVNPTGINTSTRAISVVAFNGSLTSNTAPEQVIVSAPITIVGAYVAGSGWTNSGSQTNFDGYLSTHGLGNAANPSLGYALQTGSGQLSTLPWANINTISVQFSGPVGNIGLGSLQLVGGTGGGSTGAATAAPSVTGFTSDGNNTYSWTLSSSLTNNKYVFAVATTGSSFGTPGSTQVTDANGAGISGTFATGSNAFPSGNGLAGSTFDFFFNVLPGDGNQNGAVNSSDIAGVKALINVRETAAAYNPYFDYNGAGLISSIASAVDTTNSNDKQSGISSPNAPAASQPAGSIASGSLTPLALAVQESGTSTALTAGSSQSNTATTSSAGNLSSASTTAAATTSASTGSTTGTGSGAVSAAAGASVAPKTAGTLQAAQIQATDEAVSDFTLADLYL